MRHIGLSLLIKIGWINIVHHKLEIIQLYIAICEGSIRIDEKCHAVANSFDFGIAITDFSVCNTSTYLLFCD